MTTHELREHGAFAALAAALMTGAVILAQATAAGVVYVGELLMR